MERLGTLNAEAIMFLAFEKILAFDFSASGIYEGGCPSACV